MNNNSNDPTNKYKEQMIKQIEATGKYISDNAEKIFSYIGSVVDFTIKINLPTATDLGYMPTIEIDQKIVNTSALNVYLEKEDII